MKAKEEDKQEEEKVSCADVTCPFHGSLKIRGRTYKGAVIRKFPKRVCIEFNRTVYIRKYERYANRKTRLHARLPDCLKDKINLGDYIEIGECRPLSKIIHFVVMGKVEK